MTVDEQKSSKILINTLSKTILGEKLLLPMGLLKELKTGEPSWFQRSVYFYKLPIIIKVTFPDKDDLISFVDSLRNLSFQMKKIVFYTRDWWGILWCYAYEEHQTTELQLTAYYFLINE